MEWISSFYLSGKYSNIIPSKMSTAGKASSGSQCLIVINRKPVMSNLLHLRISFITVCLHAAYFSMLKDSKQESPFGLGLSLQAASPWLRDVSVPIPFHFTILCVTLWHLCMAGVRDKTVKNLAWRKIDSAKKRRLWTWIMCTQSQGWGWLAVDISSVTQKWWSLAHGRDNVDGPFLQDWEISGIGKSLCRSKIFCVKMRCLRQ